MLVQQPAGPVGTRQDWRAAEERAEALLQEILTEDEYRQLTAMPQAQFQTQVSQLLKKYPISFE